MLKMKPIKSKLELGKYQDTANVHHYRALQVDLSIGEYYEDNSCILNIRMGNGDLLDVLFIFPYFELAFTLFGRVWPDY